MRSESNEVLSEKFLPKSVKWEQEPNLTGVVVSPQQNELVTRFSGALADGECARVKVSSLSPTPTPASDIRVGPSGALCGFFKVSSLWCQMKGS